MILTLHTSSYIQTNPFIMERRKSLGKRRCSVIPPARRKSSCIIDSISREMSTYASEFGDDYMGPIEWTEWIRTKTPSLGSVYLIPNPCIAYSYKLATDNEATRFSSHYLTLSPTGLNEFIGSKISFSSLEKWTSESIQYEKICRISFFMQFRISKSFRIWSKIVRRSKFTTVTKYLMDNSSLWGKYGALRSSLSKIMALMSSLTDMGVILLETSKTYNLEDFYGIQEERVDTFRKDLQNFRSVIKRIVYDACKATFSQSGFSLDDYRIECNYLQRQLSDNTSLSPEARYEVPKKLTFIEQSNKRLICEKLISFVHLVDWIFRIALYNCVKNTFDSIHMEMESRSAQFVIEADDGKKGSPTTASSVSSSTPMFHVVLSIYEKKIVLEPTIHNFEKVLEKYLHKLNEAINSIQLIIHDKDLNPFTRPYLYGKIDESLIQVPRDILISNHESSIRDIIKAVCNTLSKSYIICKTIFDPYEKTCEEFSEYPSIESQDNSEMTVSTDVEQLKGDMHSLTTQQKNIRELKDSFSLGLFKADFRPFKRRLLPNISKAFSKLQEALPQLGREKISSLSKCIKEVSTLAEFEPESAKDMVEHMDTLSILKQEYEDLQNKYQDILIVFAIMEKIPLPIPPEDGTAINNLKALMTSLNTIIDKREQREANKILRLSTALQEEENVLKTEISVLLNEIKSPQLTESSSSPQEIRESLLKHRNELCNVEERANVYKYYEKEFGFEITEYLEIIDANKILSSIERLWNRVEDWGNRCKEWYSIEFPTLDVEVCYDYTRKLVEEILEIRESLGKENEVLSKLEEEVTGLKSKIPCIRDLRSGSLRARHWKMISELIGMELESNSQIELTLESLDQYGVYSYHKEISKITKSAIEEEKLDNLIRELNDIWTKTRVETRVRHGILIVDNFDFLFNTWESSFITLRQLGKSRYLQQFNERLLTWSGRLEFVKTFIELLKSVQNLWAIQDVPFSCLMFKEELPSVHEYFQRTKAAFVLAMNTIIESPNILESFHNEDNYFILTDIKLHFTKTQSHLTDSLRATRLSSPRLFFLSDEELLRLLENSVGNLSALNPYLYLMFTSVQSVLFTEGDSHERCYNPFITGVCSKGGEKLMFDEPVKARLDVPHWIKTIDGDIYRTLLLELQDIMRKGIASFPQVWRDKNYLAQSQSNAAHVFWSANKDINLKELKEHCIQSIDKNTSNPSIRIKEARKLLQLLYYEQDNHSNRHDLEYVYDGNRLKVSGFGNAIQYGTEYLGYDLPFNPELTLYCPSELFHEFGVSQNAKTQRLLAGLLGKFFFSLSHFNPDLNLQNVVLGTIKLGSWTFLRDFEYVQEEDVLFLKEISIYCQLMMKDNNNLGKRFINVGGYEIPMGMFPRLRMDSSKWKIGRNFISLIQPDFQMRLRIEFVKQGHLKYESLINKLVQISRLLEPFSNNQNIDYQNKIMSALGKCTFETETDFIFYCVDKVKTLDEMKNIEHNELSHILGESWMEKFRSSETISSKLDSSFNLIVLNATELQSAVENFTCTVLNLPESMTKQKTISLSLRYLENQGYSIIKICPVSQILHPSLHLYINSIIEASNGKVVFLLHGPWNQEWVIYIGKVLMYYSNLRFILSDDSNKSEECGSKRSVQLMYDEIEEFKIIGHELSQKDFDIMYKSCILISQYILNELNEYVEAIRIMSLAINCYLQKRACDINKSLFISGAFHISIKKSVEKLHQFFMEILGVDPGIEDLKDPFDVHQLALKFSFGVKNVEPQFYVPSREQSKVIMYLKMCIEYKLSVLLCGKRGSGKSTAIRKAIKYLNNDKFETCIINMSSSQANELEKDYFVKEDAYILDKMRCYGNRVLVLILESFDIWNVKHAYFLRSLLEKSRLLWDNITKRVTPLTTYKIVTIVEVTLEYSNPNAYRDSIQRMNQFTRDLHPIHHRKDENENEMITKTILDKFITDFEKDVSETSTSIPSLINSIHESCKEHHPERVSDHNLFRVLGGILYADPEIFVRGKDFGNHVYNEIRNEYKGYGEIIYDQENIIDSKFSAKRDLKDVTSFKDSISYFYLEDGFIRIKMISLKDAMQKFSSAYSGTKGKTYNTRLVFSKSFTYLISSLIRSINRYGEVLLYGKSGHGRKSCAEFISFFLGIRLVEAPGSVEPFLKQLRTAYIDASNGEVVLLLVKLKGLNNDTIQIIRFIEEILFYGECHNLLSDNDMNEYLFDTDSQQYEANYNEKTHKDAKMALHESIREDLHFFICVEDENVHSYILKYHPFLTHRCGHHEIDYWNDDSLRSIAEDRFSGMKLSDTFPSSLTLPLLSKVSMNMQKIAVPLSKSINSFLNYLDAVRVFPSIYKPTFDHLINEKKELSSGIAQISTANELIHKLSDEISGQEPEGLRIASEIDRLQKRISQEMSNLEKASKAFRKKEVIARKRSEETKELALDAHESMERALPGLESAMAGLHALDKNEVNEIRSFKNPPESIQQVMEAVCILLGHKSDWNGAKALMSDYSFVKRLIEFDKDNIPEATLKRIRRFNDNPKCTPEDISKVSKAACTLCMWVRAVELYATIFNSIEPKRIKLLQSESELVEAMGALRAETDRVTHVETSLNNLQASLMDRTKRKENISKNLEITNVHLERAEYLSYSLEEECTRWKSQLQTTERKLRNLIGDALLQSFVVGYSGNLRETSRTELLELWKGSLSEFKICYSENENEFYDFKLDEKKELLRWYECKYFIQNSLITKFTNKWPFYIDPNNIVLKEALHLNGHTYIYSSEPEFCSKLRSSLNDGKPVIIKDFNFDYPPDFKNLFQRNLYEKVRVFVGLVGIPKMRKDVRVKLGSNNSEEVAVGSKFYLYLHSQDKTFLVEDDKINAISYNLTKESLFLKLRDDLIAKMDKPFSEEHEKYIQMIRDKTKKVNEKIRNVLLVFVKSKDSMLEDDRLITSLKDAKASVFENANELNVLKKKFSETLVPKINKFSELALQLTAYSTFLDKLAEIEPIYIFSHQKILNALHDTIIYKDIVHEIIDAIAEEVIYVLCPKQKGIFIRATQFIKKIKSEDNYHFVDVVIPRALQNQEFKIDMEIGGIHALEKEDTLSLCSLNVFLYISTLSKKHPMILIEELGESSLNIIMDLHNQQKLKIPFKYLPLSHSTPPSPLYINNILRMAKCGKSWVIIDGLSSFDAILNKLVIPSIEDDFRLFVLGNHGIKLNSNKVLTNFKMVCCESPSFTSDPLSHTIFYKNRLSFWKRDITQMNFFIRIYQWSLGKVDNRDESYSNLEKLKLIIDKFDRPLQSELDLSAIHDYIKSVFKKSCDIKVLEGFIID